MSTLTDLPLHEVILKIMYNEDKEKSVELKPKDILWKIDNPEVTERHVREALDWLVREKRVKLYLNKYSLDRYEFLDQKAKDGDSQERELHIENKTYYISPPQKNKTVRNTLILSMGVLVMLYMTYLYTQMQRDYHVSSKKIAPITIIDNQILQKKLHLSNAEDRTIDEKFNDIAYSFSRQNKNNEKVRIEITKLYKVLDSVQMVHDTAINVVQEKLDRSINYNIGYINDMLQKIIICNIVFLLIMVFIFFSNKF